MDVSQKIEAAGGAGRPEAQEVQGSPPAPKDDAMQGLPAKEAPEADMESRVAKPLYVGAAPEGS